MPKECTLWDLRDLWLLLYNVEKRTHGKGVTVSCERIQIQLNGILGVAERLFERAATDMQALKIRAKGVIPVSIRLNDYSYLDEQPHLSSVFAHSIGVLLLP